MKGNFRILAAMAAFAGLMTFAGCSDVDPDLTDPTDSEQTPGNEDQTEDPNNPSDGQEPEFSIVGKQWRAELKELDIDDSEITVKYCIDMGVTKSGHLIFGSLTPTEEDLIQDKPDPANSYVSYDPEEEIVEIKASGTSGTVVLRYDSNDDGVLDDKDTGTKELTYTNLTETSVTIVYPAPDGETYTLPCTAATDKVTIYTEESLTKRVYKALLKARSLRLALR